MIVSAYGLPGLSVLELTYMLNSIGVTYGVVINNKLTKVGETLPPVTPIVFESPSMYARTHARFGARKVSALVLGDPFTLEKEYGLPLVGATIEKSRCTFSHIDEQALKALIVDGPEVEVSRKLYDPVPAILKGFESTALAGLQTALYRVKDAETRAKVNRLVKDYFLTSESLISLERKLHNVSGEKVANLFVKLMQAEDIKRLRDAVHGAKRTPNKIKTIAKKNKVSPFDIKYLLASKAK